MYACIYLYVCVCISIKKPHFTFQLSNDSHDDTITWKSDPQFRWKRKTKLWAEKENKNSQPSIFQANEVKTWCQVGIRPLVRGRTGFKTKLIKEQEKKIEIHFECEREEARREK